MQVKVLLANIWRGKIDEGDDERDVEEHMDEITEGVCFPAIGSVNEDGTISA